MAASESRRILSQRILRQATRRQTGVAYSDSGHELVCLVSLLTAHFPAWCWLEVGGAKGAVRRSPQNIANMPAGQSIASAKDQVNTLDQTLKIANRRNHGAVAGLSYYFSLDLDAIGVLLSSCRYQDRDHIFLPPV